MWHRDAFAFDFDDGNDTPVSDSSLYVFWGGNGKTFHFSYSVRRPQQQERRASFPRRRGEKKSRKGGNFLPREEERKRGGDLTRSFLSPPPPESKFRRGGEGAAVSVFLIFTSSAMVSVFRLFLEEVDSKLLLVSFLHKRERAKPAVGSTRAWKGPCLYDRLSCKGKECLL